MKKTKLTRSLMAAVSIVALSAVMYGCSNGHSDADLDAAAEKAKMEAEQAQMDLDAAVNATEAARMAVAGLSDASTDAEIMAARMAVTEAQQAAAELADDHSLHASIAQIDTDLQAIEMARANADQQQMVADQTQAVNNALGAARMAVEALDRAGSTDEDVAAARRLVMAAQDALDAATALSDEQRSGLAGMIMAVSGTLQGIEDYRASEPGQLAVAEAAVEAAQMMVDALTDDSTPEEVGAAHAALQRAKQAVAAAENLDENVRARLHGQIADLEMELGDTETDVANLRSAQDAINAAQAAVDALGDEATSEAANAANALVAAARMALGNLSDEDAARLESQVAALEMEISGIQSEIANRGMVAAATKAAGTKEMAIAAEAMQGPDQTPANPDAGLGGSDHVNADGTADNDDDPYGLEITRDRDGTEIKITDHGMMGDDDAKFMQAMDLGDGTTMHVRMMEADDDGNVESEVVIVSTNIEAPKATAFAEVAGQALNARDLDDDVDADDDGTPTNDYTALTVTAGTDSANLPLIKSSAFVSSPEAEMGVLTFAFDDTDTTDEDEADEVGGTYNGAMGTYRCNGSAVCTVTLDDEGMITAIGAGWVFTPDEGATSDVPDDDYLHYGFWLKRTTDEEGAVTYNEVETFAGSSIAATGSVASVTGRATYDGAATGVYVHSVSNPDGTRASATSGHFTANAMLTAHFGQELEDSNVPTSGKYAPNVLNTVTGTINNFNLSGHDEGPGWSVSLEKGAIDTSAGTASGMTKGGGDEGSYNATFHGPTTATVDGATVNIQPHSVVGEFGANFSNGSVAGAFGATKDDE